MNLQKILLNKMTFVLLFAVFFPLVATAAHIITVTNTTPFPQPGVAALSTSSSVYTVKNNSTSATITVIDQSEFPASTGLSILSNTCGQPLAPQQSCVITLQFQAPATQQTISGLLKEWAKPSVDAIQVPITVSVVPITDVPFTITPSATMGGTITPSTPQIVFGTGSITFSATANANFSFLQWLLDGAVVQAQGSTYQLNNVTANHTVTASFIEQIMAIAVGADSAVTGLISISQNNGSTFARAGGAAEQANDQYEAASCTGPAPTATCIAAGEIVIGTTPPLLTSSTDGGATWATATIPGITTNGIFKAAACTGATPSVVCVAAGLDDSSGQAGLLVVSTDGASTWSVVPGVPTIGGYDAASCTGSGATAFCIAAGNDNNAATVLQSTDGGSTWAPASLPAGSENLNGTSCMGGNFCAVAGATNGGTPSVFITSDTGSTWTQSNTPNTSGLDLDTISCTGSGASAICAAAGENFVTPAPSVLVSQDGGNNWITATIPNLTVTNGSLTTSSCTGSGSTAICVLGGADLGSNPRGAFLVVSTDGGNTWSQKTINGIVAGFSSILGVSCNSNVASTLCTAVGIDGAGTLIATSTDGVTWTKNTSLSFPNAEYNGATTAN